MPIGSSNAKTRNPTSRRTRENLARKTTIQNVTRITTRNPSPHRQISVKVQVDVDHVGQEEKQRRQRRERERQREEQQRAGTRQVTKKESGEKESAKGDSLQRAVITRKPVSEIHKIELLPEKPKAVTVKQQPKDNVDGDINRERTKEIREEAQIRGRRRRSGIPRPVTTTHEIAAATRQRTSQLRRKGGETLDSSKLDKNILDLFNHVCVLKKDDISEKAEIIKNIVEKEIIMKIQDLDKRFTFDILRAGSYYEGLKVRKPNEFDIMVCMKANDVNRCFEVQVCPIRRPAKHLGGFAYLVYQDYRDRNNVWEDLLTKSPHGTGRVLSSELIVGLFKTLISRRCQTFIKSSRPKQKIKIEEPTITGPAVNVKFISEDGSLIEVDIVLCITVTNWPFNASRWGTSYRKWPSREMVDEVKSKGCHVVPKGIKEHSVYWRLSFSLAEKTLLYPRAIYEDKKYYRVIKYIYEVNRLDLEPLCSYFLKTLFLHLRSTNTFFKRQDKINIVKEFLENLVRSVQNKMLQHFFIPDVNLFVNFTDSETRRITKFLKRILLNFRDNDSARNYLKELKFADTQT